MCNRNNTCLVSVAISLVIGVIAALTFFFALLPGISTFIIIALILAAIAIFAVLLTNGKKEDWCLCKSGICLVVGIAGTIAFGIIASLVTLVTGSIAFAVLIGLVGFFAALTLSNLVVLLICIAEANCSCKNY